MLTRYPTLDAVLKLQFEPVHNARPRAFSRPQIEQFNEQGFIGPIPLFSGDALLRLQRFFRENDAPMKELRDKAKTFISLHHLVPGLHDIVTYRRTVRYLQDLLGPNVLCHTSEFLNKPPKQTKG